LSNLQNSKRRTQAERSGKTRMKVCEATLDALVEVGYERISTPLIAEKANVSRGALTHHFPRRNDLLLAAHLHLIDGWRKSFPFDQVGLDKKMGIEELVAALWKNIFSEERYAAAMELMLAARQDNELGHALRETLAAWLDERDQIVMKLTESEDLDDAVLFAQLNLAVLPGIAMHQSFERGEDRTAELLSLWKTVAKDAFNKMKAE